MSKFEKLFVNFMIIGLIVLGLLIFASILQEDNSITDKFIEHPILNDTYTTLNNSLVQFGGKSQAHKTLFESENPTSSFGSILLVSIVSGGKIFNGMILSVFNILIKLPVAFLDLDPAIVSVFSTILILAIILGLWSIYKLGG